MVREGTRNEGRQIGGGETDPCRKSFFHNHYHNTTDERDGVTIPLLIPSGPAILQDVRRHHNLL